ncbi:MAG TPA: N-acetyl-gamma-glutamyl-phosphate reductase [Dehalococcoidia bacterium]|nr:N-acetyl-gamma-glutamyl-phosphate reductase [Dehalococcoidia bacterium]
MGDRKRAQIVGATGYGGLGILELLLEHPGFEVASISARDDAGRRIDEVYPHLTGRCEMVVEPPDRASIGEGVDVVVFATPDRVSQGYARGLADAGVRFIDYSGDFRFASEADYAAYAQRHPSIAEVGHQAPELLGRAVYGVSELNAARIAAAPIVGNPGCFAMGMILGLAPLFADGLVEGGLVAVDALTGSSGAGKKPAPQQHFSHLNDNVVPYRVLSHQHVVESEQTLGRLGKASGATLDFVPHLLGTTRGILSTMHATLTKTASRQALLDRYREFYDGSPFVRILDQPPTLKGTLGSNYCDISLALSADGKRVVVMSSIDNLLKGQSGSAVQNLNLMFGFDQAAGLTRGPVYP